MVDFSKLKKSSGSLERLTKELEKVNAAKTEKRTDDRFWQPEVDKVGNGMATFRFLPAPAVDGDDALPWVRIFSHGFKGPTGKWYIENSLTTLGNNVKDPVGEYNSQLWNASSDDNSWQRKQARAQKRKLTYIANIYMIHDPRHPENEGKVFLFKFGKKLFDKITSAMNPEFEGDEPVNPFDFWAGANFKLRIRTIDRTDSNPNGYRNYDQSMFEAPSALLGGDDTKLEAIWKSEHSLKEFIDPKNFKSYDELKRLLDDVLGSNAKKSDPAPLRPFSDLTEEDGPAPRPAKVTTAANSAPFDTDEDDEELAAFKALALG